MTRLEQRSLDEAFGAHFALLFGNLCLGWSDPQSIERFERGLSNLREAYAEVRVLLDDTAATS